MSSVLGDISVGTPVAVLLCDVDDLDGLVESFGTDWPEVVDGYQALLRDAIEGNGGYVEDGDATSFFGSFLDVDAAVHAAIEIQRGLRAAAWPEGNAKAGRREVKACVGLHMGRIGEGVFINRNGGARFVGLDVHRATRVKGAANGGQVLVTGSVRDLTGGESRRFEDLGFYRLRDFPENVRLFHLVVDEDRRASAFSPPKTLDYRPTNLTADDRPLFGRGQLIGQVKSGFLDSRHRLVTLVGPGGVGKTRVGIAAGSELLEEHRGGVWLVRAEALSSSEELLGAIATVLGVRDVPGKSLVDSLVNRVQQTPMLLILDNLEQVVGAGELVSQLVNRTVPLRILVTSQTPLHIDSEKVLRVPRLSVDDGCRLFSVAAPGQQINLSDSAVRDSVTQLVGRLDYLPLAIELAAAQLRTLSFDELSRELESRLKSFAPQPGKPERQQSLQAVIDWSVAALPAEAKQLFVRFGVFAGVATLDLMEEICGRGIDVVEAAATLVDFSLLRRIDVGLGMPPAIHQTAQDRFIGCDQEDELRRLHALAMTKQSVDAQNLNKTGVTMNRQAAVLDNDFNAAVKWAAQHSPEIHVDLTTNLSAWWGLTGRNKIAIEHDSAALEFAGLSDPKRVLLLNARAAALIRSGMTVQALVDIEAGLSLVGRAPSKERARLLRLLSIIQERHNDTEAAVHSAADAADICRQLNLPMELLEALLRQIYYLAAAGNLMAAEPILQEASAIAKLPENKDAFLATSGLANARGDWLVAAGRPLEALQSYGAAITASEWTIFQTMNHIAGAIIALAQLGHSAQVIELSVSLKRATSELGYNFNNLAHFPIWPEQIFEAACKSLDSAEIAKATAHGENLSVGQLATRVLAIERQISERQ